MVHPGLAVRPAPKTLSRNGDALLKSKAQRDQRVEMPVRDRLHPAFAYMAADVEHKEPAREQDPNRFSPCREMERAIGIAPMEGASVVRMEYPTEIMCV
jgi:hypothetical protein